MTRQDAGRMAQQWRESPWRVWLITPPFVLLGIVSDWLQLLRAKLANWAWEIDADG